MCFVINMSAPRRESRIGYKVVRINKRGYLQSQYYHERVGGKRWYPGAVVKCSPGPSSSRSSFGSQRAWNGIYVYTSAQIAKSAAGRYGSGSSLVVLKVKVDPKDWRHTGTGGGVSLYGKVTVPEEQPYLDWYE